MKIRWIKFKWFLLKTFKPKQFKNLVMDIEKLIICGDELEAYDYNKKFYGYDGRGFDVAQNKRMYKNAKARASRIINRHGWDRLDEISKINSRLEYSMQFL